MVGVGEEVAAGVAAAVDPAARSSDLVLHGTAGRCGPAWTSHRWCLPRYYLRAPRLDREVDDWRMRREEGRHGEEELGRREADGCGCQGRKKRGIEN